MGKMKKYDSYKDSGVDWIGEIPSHWKLTRIKFKYSIGRGRVISNEDLVDGGKFPVYSSQTQNNGCLGYIDSYDFDDKLITWTTDGANAGTVFLREGKYNCTNVCGTLKPKSEKVIPEFDYYFLQYASQFYKRPDTNGAKIMNNEMAVILAFEIPSMEEQTAIANYLDQKTAQIDELVAKKERLIQLLEEERTAIINQAVTKGLDPTVPMKDSGIDWLGEIPAHWQVILFKRVISKIKDGTHGTFQRLSHGYPFLSAKNVFNDGLRISEAESLISKKDYFEITKNGFPKRNDLLITCVGTIGRTFVYDLDEPLAFQRSVTFIRFNDNTNPHFYKFYVQSSIYQNLLISLAKTSAQSGIYMNDLLNTYALKIPLVEQSEIVEFLKTTTSEIDDVILKTQQEIELLSEYKTALISEVVTGNVDVRDEKLS